jgi:hypothetical protein
VFITTDIISKFNEYLGIGNLSRSSTFAIVSVGVLEPWPNLTKTLNPVCLLMNVALPMSSFPTRVPTSRGLFSIYSLTCVGTFEKPMKRTGSAPETTLASITLHL